MGGLGSLGQKTGELMRKGFFAFKALSIRGGKGKHECAQDGQISCVVGGLADELHCFAFA